MKQDDIRLATSDVFNWEKQGDKADGTALLARLEIAGVPFHVNAIRVTTKASEGTRSAETGWPCADGVQQPVKGDASLYEDLLNVYDDALATVKIPGHPGDWVLIIHPYGD